MTRRWFIVADHPRSFSRSGAMVFSAGSLAHAKEMGTTRTACGIPVGGRVRLWEHAFPGDTLANCSDCLRAVGAMSDPARSTGERGEIAFHARVS